MQHKLSRRLWVRGALATGAFIGLAARADPLSTLDPNAPDAKALGFQTDASKVAAEGNPSFKAGQRCGSCSQFRGESQDGMAACAIFGGRQVPSGGWCRVWTLRSAGG